jgi:branched-chain amino acid transport system substrate-binding protein
MITKRLLCFIGLLAFANLSMAKPPIILAAVYNLSGSQSSLDKASLQGAKLAVQKINAKGGVLGRQLVLQVKDGKSQVSILKKLGEQLAKNKNIQLAFGVSDSGMLRTFLPVYLKSGKLFVNSGATGANLTQQFPKRFFLTTFTNNVQASGGAKFIMDQLHRKKTIVLYQGDMSYARNLANYFVDAYQHAGGKVTDKRSVGKIISIETLNSLKHQPLSVIYLAAAPNRVPNLIKQIRQAKITLPIMGGDSYVVNDITALSATVADSVYFTTLGSYDRNFMDPSMVAFVKYYQKH